MTEHEFDHILIGNFDGEPELNPEEANDWKWISLENLKEDMEKNPQLYTEWFKIIFDNYYNHIKQ